MNRPQKTISVALALLAAVALAALGLASGCGGEVKKGEVYYCPMHPTYVSDRPGDCPICNMRLIKKEEHAREAPAAKPERQVLFYRSPMDPTVTSPVPQKDEMGMDYIPVYSDEIEGSAGSVTGYATVQASEQRLQLAGVRTEVARRGSLRRMVRTVGAVQADETRLHRLQTKISGWVEHLYVNFTGQLVQKGQPILAIYSPELLSSQQEYVVAREQGRRFLASSVPEVRRGGEDLIRAARQRLELFDVPESFLAELERTEKPLRTVDLDAPASGYVVAKEVLEGTRVEPGMELFTIADLSRVWVEADFYEYEAAEIRVGQEAALRLAYEPAVALTARVAYVYPQLAVETRTLRVRFDVANPGLRLKPGMFVDVELALGGEETLIVPDSAVLDTGLRQIAFVETGPGSFEPRELQVGVRSGGEVQVISGLAEGEKVAVKANFLLDSESRLRAAIGAGGAGRATAPAQSAPTGHEGHRP